MAKDFLKNIPAEKVYFTIGDVAAIFKVNTSLIRFWESEFPMLKPHKNTRGERKFTRKDLSIIAQIYKLVKEEGFTLDGARKQFKTSKTSENKDTENEILQRLQHLKNAILQWKDEL
jgi:DNA-binding transcriptional MerR regulator